MRRNKFLEYLLIQFSLALLVMVIFKVIPDRQMAATVAGVLFMAMPIGLMIWEHRRAGFQETIWFVVMLQFLIVFAIPILGLRLWNWGVPFDQLFFWGIPGPALHQWSSKSYILMMGVTGYCWRKSLRKKSPSPGKRN